VLARDLQLTPGPPTHILFFLLLDWQHNSNTPHSSLLTPRSPSLLTPYSSLLFPYSSLLMCDYLIVYYCGAVLKEEVCSGEKAGVGPGPRVHHQGPGTSGGKLNM